MKTIIAVALGLGVVKASEISFVPVGVTANASRPLCPPCDLIFVESKHPSGGVGPLATRIRGEPKSGTTFVSEWTASVLVHACDYLRNTFGNDSCDVDVVMKNSGDHSLDKCMLTFEPKRVKDDTHCNCDSIERVEIHLYRGGKHRLPVARDCPWQHGDSLDYKRTHPCVFKNNKKPRNFEELSRCVREKSCSVDVRNEKQTVVFRDPRAIAVSTYYYVGARSGKASFKGSVDDFVVSFLPTLCKWLAIRSMVFEGYAARNSKVFWYEDTVAEPMRFHVEWLESVGLNLPEGVIKEAVETALRGDFAFETVGIDPHAGQGTDLRSRSFQNTLRDETLTKAESILRTWLPPHFLAKLGIP